MSNTFIQCAGQFNIHTLNKYYEFFPFSNQHIASVHEFHSTFIVSLLLLKPAAQAQVWEK